MAPGEAESTDELAELVGDGIYVTRLHYLGVVNPREGVITGMTRDGTFRIRDGKVAEPLVNLRFTVAMPELLADVPGPDARDAARQPERLLRRALGVRLPRPGDRDRLLQRHRRRLRARALRLPCCVAAASLCSPPRSCSVPRARPAPRAAGPADARLPDPAALRARPNRDGLVDSITAPAQVSPPPGRPSSPSAGRTAGRAPARTAGRSAGKPNAFVQQRNPSPACRPAPSRSHGFPALDHPTG